ncbi:LysR substrate-binding domain-containing protein [Frigidibacter sp. SD6-1]|uniref:LysR substrate-binding domain-containing protein n=1 Tax=Frigidibacter sp. SD6-1 TaxID=3032581 RepID=UPI0024DFABC6|nr:LysR substrate-binding domain-containing protein [Frigidibacter sp. SD6-1]
MEDIEKFFRHGLNIRHLRLLVALDDHRSVRRVSAYLNISQPAVSKTLASLETGLGVLLFHRRNTGIEPTMTGAALIRNARKVLSQLYDAQSELLDINQNRVGRLSLGILPVAAVLLVPRLVSRIEEIASSATIKITEGTMATLLPALRAGDIDLAIGLLPYGPLAAEFDSELLIEDPMVAATRQGHPLTREASPTWEDLAQFPMVLPPGSANTRLPIDSILAAHRLTPSARRVETVSTMASVGTLQFTDSVAFIAQSLARHFADLGVASILPLEIPDVTIRIGMIWLKAQRFTEAHAIAQRLLREIASDMDRNRPAGSATRSAG